MKNTTEHTPGPLKYCKNRYGGYDLLPADSYLIGSAVSIGGTNSEARAAYIVRACNAHDELLEALKILSVGLSNEMDYKEMRLIIRGAINKATGET